MPNLYPTTRLERKRILTLKAKNSSKARPFTDSTDSTTTTGFNFSLVK
jgi:hypothetical protein